MEIMKAEELRKSMEEKFYSEEVKKLALEVIADKVMTDIKKAANNTVYFYEFDLENIIRHMDINAKSTTDNYYKAFKHLTLIKNCFEAGDKTKYWAFIAKLQKAFIDAGYTVSQDEGLKNRYKFTISWNKKKDEK